MSTAPRIPIEYVQGDILMDDSEVLVNPVNCVGVMGKGLALEFKHRWPENFEAYRQACEAGRLAPARPLLFETEADGPPKYIINFPTKRHWRDRSDIVDIVLGLVVLVKTVRSCGVRSIALPALGCGLGGLPWGTVRRAIDATLGPLQGVRVRVYEPRGKPVGVPRKEKS